VTLVKLHVQNASNICYLFILQQLMQRCPKTTTMSITAVEKQCV